MVGDDFAERLAVVRERFATKLAGRLAEIDAAMPRLVGEGGAVNQAVDVAHRKVHDLCGIGPTLGFHATGAAARVCERILLQPFRGLRGLTEQEMAHLREGFAALRVAAQNDLQSSGLIPE
jgi:hypothetical protein